MKDIRKVVNKNTFLDSYRILLEYIQKRGDDIQDVNLILVSKYLSDLSDDKIKKFYNKYIETGLIYSLPEFYTSDLVTIPKGVADIREYRFFSSFGLILYNAIGIFFADTCSEMIDTLNFQRRNIYSYAPTKYQLVNNKWKINNKWQAEYNKFKDKISEEVNKSDVVLSLDISNFFNSIRHKKLIEVINDFISAQNREKYSYDSSSEDILSFYLLSMMGDNEGLPQGKKNFASDYLAYLYMTKFDMEAESLVSSKNLKHISIVRYVDDIHIFFKNDDDHENKVIYKELSKVEHAISKWLYENLGLSLNDKKTTRKIIINENQKKDFVGEVLKRTSQEMSSNIGESELDDKIDAFINAVKEFIYPDEIEFSGGLKKLNIEDLKHIFENPVKQKLASPALQTRMMEVLKSIDFELSAAQFNIFGSLFEIAQGGNNLYIKTLIDYLSRSFDPRDKRHIHIALLSSVVILKNSVNSIFKPLIKNSNEELLKDDYGKYLSLYYFPNSGLRTKTTTHWLNENRVYQRICLESNKKAINYPYILENIHHGFKSILFLPSGKNKKLDSIYTALNGYIHEFTFERWSVAFNKLQMVVHEGIKYRFKIKDGDTNQDIIKALSKGGLSLSSYEERDLLRLWERRNFNPVSHGSKNGLTSPEITKKELTDWEIKICKLVPKIFQTP